MIVIPCEKEEDKKKQDNDSCNSLVVGLLTSQMLVLFSPTVSITAANNSKKHVLCSCS